MKKLGTCILLLLVLAMPLGSLADGITKDETVYALLSPDGTEKQVLVVSHIDTPEAGDYVDYGTYKEVSAMVRDVEPLIDGEAITWTLPADPKGFYAVGEPEAAQLPFLFEIAYTLDGEAIAPEALAGQSGRVEIIITVRINAVADEAFRSQYMAQVQVPLSLSVASGIDAPGATSALVGQTQTITYTALPGQDVTYTLAFDAVDFSLGNITIACAAMDIRGMLGMDLEEILSQVTAMQDGTRQLADGTAKLESGLTQVFAMLGALPDKAATLAEGATGVEEAATAYVEAVQTFLASLDGVDTAALDAQGTALLEALAAQSAAVSTLSTSLKLLVTQTKDVPDSLSQLSSGSLALADGLDEALLALDEMPLLTTDVALHSFASPDQSVRSVQFVYMTEAIAVPAEETAAPAEEAAQTFWQRLTALFE